MRTLRIIFGSIVLFVALVIGGAFAWWKINYPTYTYRYRMTVEVADGDKVYSGSSVIEVRIDTQPPLGSAPPYVPHMRGEAVFVDLGGGRNVIALLAGGPRAENVNYSDSIVPGLFELPFKNWAKLPYLRGRREVPASRMPTFVTFTDLNDAKSAHVVQPAEFPQVFGANVHLKDVKIDMTSDAVTRTIEKKMPAIIEAFRVKAKTSHPRRVGSPYSPALGHFSVFERGSDMTISSDLFQAVIADASK